MLCVSRPARARLIQVLSLHPTRLAQNCHVETAAAAEGDEGAVPVQQVSFILPLHFTRILLTI